MRSLLRDLKSNPRRHVQNVLLKYEPHFKFIKVVMQKQDQPREPSYVIDAWNQRRQSVPSRNNIYVGRTSVTAISEATGRLCFSLGLTSYTDDYTMKFWWEIFYCDLTMNPLFNDIQRRLFCLNHPHILGSGMLGSELWRPYILAMMFVISLLPVISLDSTWQRMACVY